MPTKITAAAVELEDYVKQLEAAGATIVGEGYHSVVLSHPEDATKVIKVSHTDSSVAYEWLKWCKANPNKYVPLVHSLSKVSRKGYFVAVVERLKPITRPQFLAFLDAEDLNEVLTISKTVHTRWDIQPDKLATIENKLLRRVMTRIYVLSESMRYVYGQDITVDNILRRGNQIVFNDPVT